ncbi:acyl CoA:acetate/3-ketoacid CoA transferase [Occultella gossypii]|uniref:Acyl CoA:acetate/3-ketoacid CoA transferase n=1 Tax=Occultella gossypii TaxID=2800820 RepID=A0ABS7S5D6_9MICO|nr:CoA-transferase [Occultella gossypii]MBZ2195556.1 acyl CoA:acetate/3-ketoacid CoA transferase [Occultella gossypii]
MRTPPIVTADEAVGLIADGATVTVSSSSGLGCPDAVLAALGRRYRDTSAPGGLTLIHPIAAGDMYGIKGIDHLAEQPGQLSRLFAGSLPSGPSDFGPPAVRALIESGGVQAYNIPSGVLFQMHRAAATRQPGVLTEVGAGTFADPRQDGARMNAATEEFVRIEHLAGKDWLFYPALSVDVAIIRATTADPFGNLSFEQEGGTLGALDQAYAAHNNGGIVIAQVKRTSPDRLPPSTVRVPGIVVDVVVVVPEQMQTTQISYDPTISGEASRSLAEIEPLPWGPEKVIARRAAAALHHDDIVNLGFGLSAGVPRVLLEAGHEDEVTWVIEQGPIGGFPLTGFAFGSAMNPHALMPSIDQFTLLAGGGIDVAMLSFLQISGTGDVNVSHLPSRSHVTVGIGGFADITTFAPHVVLSGYFTAGSRDIEVGDGRLTIRQDGDVAKFVTDVAQISFAARNALDRGQQVTVVTERAVLRLTPAGLEVTEIAPGIDLRRDVLDRADCDLLVSDDLRLMDHRLFREVAPQLELGPRRRPLLMPAGRPPVPAAPPTRCGATSHA